MFIVVCVGLMALAATQDRAVAQHVHDRDWKNIVHNSAWAKIVKSPGDFRFTLGVAAVIIIFNRQKYMSAVQLLGAGITSGLIYTVVKWVVGRTRPFPSHAAYVPPFEFHPFIRGLAGLIKADNMAFPSGHTGLAFATAATLSTIAPRGAVVYYFIAIAVGVERVLEGAHYPSDVVGGLLFGVLAAYLADRTAHKVKHNAGLPAIEK